MEIEQYIAQRRANKSPLVMTHVVCGYPSLEANLQALEVMNEFGVDFVELQFPFSEPSADGPLFVKANQLAIERGTRIDDCFELMRIAHERFDFKLLMMGYYNTVFKMGHAQFLQRLKAAGGSGYILPDLPLEEAQDLHQLSKAEGITPILLMTPTNSDARLAQIAKAASGLVYTVARKGVTGGKTQMTDAVAEFLLRCKRQTDLPLGVGFGVSSPEDIAFIGQHADVAIIGTAALRAWEAGGAEALRRFFQELGI